jgi:hypothetical protein
MAKIYYDQDVKKEYLNIGKLKHIDYNLVMELNK